MQIENVGGSLRIHQTSEHDVKDVAKIKTVIDDQAAPWTGSAELAIAALRQSPELRSCLQCSRRFTQLDDRQMPSSGLKFKRTTCFGILLLVLPAAATTRADAKTVKTVVGIASYYGRSHQGRRMANGKRFDERKLTAASRQLQLGSRARVTSLRNKKTVVVTITDRGPYAKHRVIDLSTAAARRIGMIRHGVDRVRVEPLRGSRVQCSIRRKGRKQMRFRSQTLKVSPMLTELTAATQNHHEMQGALRPLVQAPPKHPWK
jgi:rare lipoprotein A